MNCEQRRHADHRFYLMWKLHNQVVKYATHRLNELKHSRSYKQLLKDGNPPEIARAILPLCLKTELYMTANLREWRWILKQRTSKAAHPQMRRIANQILAVFKDKLPVIVEDIGK